MMIRIFAIIALVLSFAGPFIKNNQNLSTSERNKIVVFLDNSLSMTGTGEDGLLFEAAKNRARNIVESYPQHFVFQLVSHAGTMQADELLDKAEMLDEIDKLNIVYHATTPDEIQRQLNKLSDEKTKVIWISDFRKGFLENLNVVPESLAKHFWLPLQASHSDNISIDSAWFESPAILPNQNLELFVKLTNHGLNDVADIPLQLFEGNSLRGGANFSVDAGKFIVIKIPFNSGKEDWKSLSIRLPADPFNYDDNFFISFPVQKSSKGLILNDLQKSKYLQAILTQDAGFEIETISPLQVKFDRLNDLDFLIIDGTSELSSGLIAEIKNFVQNGGNLMVYPSATGNNVAINNLLQSLQSGSYNSLIQSEVNAALWDNKNPLLQGVFSKPPKDINLPQILKYYTLTPATRQQSLWKLNNDAPLFLTVRRGSGNIFLASVALDPNFGNLTMNPLFVPFVLRLASYKESTHKLFYTTGSHEQIPLEGIQLQASEIWNLKSEKLNLIPEIIIRDRKHFLALHGEVEEEGFYSLSVKDEQTQMILAFNYPRSESVVKTENEQDLKAFAENYGIEIVRGNSDSIASSISQNIMGKVLWKWFILLSLIFVLIEMILIRIWRM